jgi:hypothetical protein
MILYDNATDAGSLGTTGAGSGTYELDRYLSVTVTPPGGPGGLATYSIPAGKFVKWILVKSLAGQTAAIEGTPGAEDIMPMTVFNANEITPYAVNTYYPVATAIRLSAGATAIVRVLIIYIDINL